MIWVGSDPELVGFLNAEWCLSSKCSVDIMLESIGLRADHFCFSHSLEGLSWASSPLAHAHNIQACSRAS